MENVTTSSIFMGGYPNNAGNPFTKGGFVKQYFPVSDIMLLINGLIGIIGNSVALFILSSSARINKSSFYALLMNQSVADVISSAAMVVFVLTNNLTSASGLSTGVLDQLYCHVVFSGVAITGANCSSSMNLGALSLERMACEVFPIRHRTGVTRGLGRRLAVLAWILGAASVIPLSAVANGVNLEQGGTCYFWNHFASDVSTRVYTVLFTAFTFAIPLTIMLLSFALIYARLMQQHTIRDAMKLNVVKTLTTCVLLFFVCNDPKSLFGMISHFGGPSMMHHWIFPYAIFMMMSNVAVNPFVYSFQYSDYQTELKRQFYRFIGNKEKMYALNSIRRSRSQSKSSNSNSSVKTVNTVS